MFRVGSLRTGGRSLLLRIIGLALILGTTAPLFAVVEDFDCEALLEHVAGSFDDGDFDAAILALETASSRLSEPDRYAIARTLFSAPSAPPEDFRRRFIAVVGRDLAHSAYLDARKEAKLAAVVLDGRHGALIGLLEDVATATNGNLPLAEEICTSYAGARALAFRTLGQTAKANAAFDEFVKYFPKEPGSSLYLGYTQLQLRALFEKLSKMPSVVARINTQEAAFASFFLDRPDWYDTFAHHPLFWAFVHQGADRRLLGPLESASLIDGWEHYRLQHSLPALNPFIGYVAERMKTPAGRAAAVSALKDPVHNVDEERAARYRTLSRFYHLDELRPSLELQYIAALTNAATALVSDRKNARPFVDSILHFPKLNEALGSYIRGLDNIGREFLYEYFEDRAKSKGEPVDEALRSKYGRAITAFAKDPDVQRTYTYLTNMHFWPEQVLLNGAQISPFIDHPHFPGAQTETLSFNPSNAHLVKEVLQYGNLGDASKVLEIGYGGLPAVLHALDKVIPGRTYGIDVLAPPAAFPGMGDLHLMQGNPPKDEATKAMLKSAGPFSVIYGKDVFKTHFGFGDFKPEVPNAEYLRWIAETLEDGGMFLAYNDFGYDLNFSRAEVLAAGFEIVRWRVPRPFTDHEQKYFRNDVMHKPGPVLYALRKGKFDPKRIRTAASVTIGRDGL